MAGRLAGKTAFITAAAQGMGQRRGARLRARGRAGLGDRRECAAAERARRQGRHPHAGAGRHRRGGHRQGGAGSRRHRRALQLRRHRAPRLDPRCAATKDWDQAFSVNVKSMFLVSRAFLPGMLKKRTRLDHQHGVGGLVHPRAAEPLRLRREQGRGDRPHQVDRRRLRRQGHPLQRHLPRARSTRRRCRDASTPSPTRCRRARISSRASRWGGSARSRTSRGSWCSSPRTNRCSRPATLIRSTGE